MSDEKFKHPELREGEVLYGNKSLTGFKKLSFQTKRLGKIAYSNTGENFSEKGMTHLKPVFIQQTELEAHLAGKTFHQKPRRRITVPPPLNEEEYEALLSQCQIGHFIGCTLAKRDPEDPILLDTN